jgi:hypothetical protein
LACVQLLGVSLELVFAEQAVALPKQPAALLVYSGGNCDVGGIGHGVSPFRRQNCVSVKPSSVVSDGAGVG